MDRLKLITQKLSLHFAEDEAFPNCVYLFGQKAVGKSVCLQKFLDSQREWLESVVINSPECYTSKILFETIINAFNHHELSDENYYESFAKVDTIEEFLDELSELDVEKSYLIVIRKAEKLRDMDFNILPVLTRLQERSGLNISCVLVSHLALEKFDIEEQVVRIHVPDLNKNEVIEILLSQYQDIQKKIGSDICKNSELSETEKNDQMKIVEKLDGNFYHNYLNIFMNVFYKANRDITELQFLSNKCYSSYYAPVLSGEILYSDVTNLWRKITKVMKISLQTGHMRIENLSAKDLTQKLEEQPDNSLKRFAQTLELPYYAKYLLIASFLASHNEAKYDKRLFMKHHGKEKKRRKRAHVTENMNVQFGPKSFSIDRLLAIFFAILDEKLGLTCNLLSQISTLVDLNFLTYSSGQNNIMEGNARLQSTIGMDFAINIGKVVQFNVKQYLTDFY